MLPELSLRSDTQILQDEPDAHGTRWVGEFEGADAEAADEIAGEHAAGSGAGIGGRGEEVLVLGGEVGGGCGGRRGRWRRGWERMVGSLGMLGGRRGRVVVVVCRGDGRAARGRVVGLLLLLLLLLLGLRLLVSVGHGLRVGVRGMLVAAASWGWGVVLGCWVVAVGGRLGCAGCGVVA